MVGVGIRELVNDTDGPAFLERELLGTCRSKLTTVQVDRCPGGRMWGKLGPVIVMQKSAVARNAMSSVRSRTT